MRAVFRHLLRTFVRDQQSLARRQILGGAKREVKIERDYDRVPVLRATKKVPLVLVLVAKRLSVGVSTAVMVRGRLVSGL